MLAENAVLHIGDFYGQDLRMILWAGSRDARLTDAWTVFAHVQGMSPWLLHNISLCSRSTRGDEDRGKLWPGIWGRKGGPVDESLLEA